MYAVVRSVYVSRVYVKNADYEFCRWGCTEYTVRSREFILIDVYEKLEDAQRAVVSCGIYGLIVEVSSLTTALTVVNGINKKQLDDDLPEGCSWL